MSSTEHIEQTVAKQLINYNLKKNLFKYVNDAPNVVKVDV